MRHQRNMRQLVAVALVREAVRKEPPKRVKGRIVSPEERLALMDAYNKVLQDPKKERVKDFQKMKKEDRQLAVAV